MLKLDKFVTRASNHTRKPYERISYVAFVFIVSILFKMIANGRSLYLRCYL